MAGPADYLRLTGPLGGANFLNTSDYIRGAQASMMPANQTMDTIQQGAQIGQTVAQTRALAQQTDQRQKVIAQEEAQRKAASEAMKWAAQTMTGAAQVPQSAPTTPMQSATPMPTAPVIGVQGGQRSAPVAPQAPVQQAVQESAMPVQQSAPAAMPQAAPVQAAPQQPVMPPTTAAQASQQPVPQSAATQTARQAAPQPPTLSQRVAGVRSEIQKIEQTSDLVMSKLYEDVQAGRISPEAAIIVEQGLTNKRKNDADRIISFESKLAEISEKWAKSDKSEEEARKARLETARATVEFEDSGYYQVKKTFETMGPEMAIAEAASLGLDPATVVTQDGKLSPVAEKRANRSPEAREERRAAEIKWTFDKDLGVATGVDKEGRVMIRDSEGKVMTSAEFRALGVNQKERVARAGRATTGGGRVRSGGQVTSPSQSKAVRDLDVSTRGAFDNSIAAIKSVERVLNTGIVEKASGIQNVIGLTKLPLGPWRQAQQDIINVFNNAVLDYKMALTQAGGSVRSFDANKEAEALERAVANLDWSAGDKFVRQQLQGIIDRMNRGVTQLNRAREAEGLPPLTAQGSSTSAARQPALPAPKSGDIRDGFVFKGGDPNKQENWAPIRRSGGATGEF